MSKKPKKKKTTLAAEVARDAKLNAHPLRIRILTALAEGVKSPNMLAKELDEPLGNVSYHVKQLLEGERVELVKTEPRRGAVEHFYKLVAGKRSSESAALDEISRVLCGRYTEDERLVAIAEVIESTGRANRPPQAKAA